MRKISLVVLVSFLVSLFVPAIAMSQSEISIALHDSPWLPALKKVLPEYEKTSGVRIKLNVYPYDGLYQKLQTSLAAQSDDFDIVFMDDPWIPFFYSGSFITPLKEIDPNFELDPNIIEYAYATRWDSDKNYTTASGELMSLPINGNLQLFYYREDLLDEAGIEPPETWNDVLNIAEKFHDPNKPLYGFVTGGQRGNRVVFDWLPFLRSFGGNIFADPENGDFTVILNDEAGKNATNTWLELMTQYGPPGIADVGQSDVMALLSTGQAVQGVAVAALYPFMDDPEYSLVPYKIGYQVIPKANVEGGQHTTSIGIWVMGIPRASKNKEAALDFMKWVTSKEVQMEYTRAGAVPVRSDVLESELAEEPRYRYLKAMADSFPVAKERPRIKEWFEVEDILGLYLNKVLIGELSGEEALDIAAKEIYELMKEKGYKTGLIESEPN